MEFNNVFKVFKILMIVKRESCNIKAKNNTLRNARHHPYGHSIKKRRTKVAHNTTINQPHSASYTRKNNSSVVNVCQLMPHNSGIRMAQRQMNDARRGEYMSGCRVTSPEPSHVSSHVCAPPASGTPGKEW